MKVVLQTRENGQNILVDGRFAGHWDQDQLAASPSYSAVIYKLHGYPPFYFTGRLRIDQVWSKAELREAIQLTLTGWSMHAAEKTKQRSDAYSKRRSEGGGSGG